MGRRAGLALVAISAAIGAAGTASAACNIEQAGLTERHEALAAERGILTVEARRSFRALRRSAEALERNGHDIACEAVVETALRLLEDPAVWAEPAVEAIDPDAGVGQLNLAGLDAADRPLESAALLGRSVLSTSGVALGEVDGVLLDQARDASHLVVTQGDFWGSTGQEIAVPTRRVLIDAESGALFVDIGVATLAEAPGYAHADAFDAEANDAWYEARADEAATAREALALKRRSAERNTIDAAMATPTPPAAGADKAVAEGREDGPKRMRVEKDRPGQAEGSND